MNDLGGLAVDEARADAAVWGFLKNAQRLGFGRPDRHYACRVPGDRFISKRLIIPKRLIIAKRLVAPKRLVVPKRLIVLLAVGGAGGVLGACGGSGSDGTAASASATQTQATSSTAASTSTSAAAPAGCRSVSAPTPKGTRRVSAPTLKLDPAKRYSVSMSTNCGTIEILLDVRHAPKTAASFAYLARSGFYDNLTFHRVAAGFVIQGGDPNGDGSGGPGYTIVERPPSTLKYSLGTVAMAKSGNEPAGSSGSQFFIVTGAQVSLPPEYALVGKVVGGLAAVQAISKIPTTPPQDGAPTSPVVISSASLTNG